MADYKILPIILSDDKKDKEEMKHQWYVGDTTYPAIKRLKEEKLRIGEGYLKIQRRDIGASFILGHATHSVLGTNTLGDARGSWTTDRIVHSEDTYKEFFTDTTFYDSTNSSVTWSTSSHLVQMLTPATAPETVSSLRLTSNSETISYAILTAEDDTRNYAIRFKNCTISARNDNWSGSSASVPSSAMSVEAWVKLDAVSDRDTRFISSYGYPSNTGSWQLALNTVNQLEFCFYNGSSTVSAQSTAEMTASVWMHICGTWDGTTIRLYIDNSTISDTGTYTGTVYNTSGIQLSRISSDWGNIAIDEVRIYNRALSYSEVSYSYVNRKPFSTSGMFNWWAGNDGSGITISDTRGGTTLTISDISYTTPNTDYYEWIDGVHENSSITYFLSADDGSHWETVSKGTQHNFTNTGQYLRWKAGLTNEDNYTNPYIEEVAIEYG